MSSRHNLSDADTTACKFGSDTTDALRFNMTKKIFYVRRDMFGKPDLT